MKDTSKVEQEEAFLETIKKLLHTNYLILELLDHRLVELEDWGDQEKKKGN